MFIYSGVTIVFQLSDQLNLMTRGVQMRHQIVTAAAVAAISIGTAASASAESITVLGGGLKGGAYAMAKV